MALFSDLGFLILFAAIAGVLAIRFRQPAVLGLLVIGALVGPNSLGLIQESEIVTTFADVGAVLLLFTIGIEFNVSKLSKLGLRVFLIAIFKLGIVFLLSYWFGTFLGLFGDFGPLMPLYLGAILSISSTALVVRVLEQKEMINRKEVPILVAALIVEDLFAIFALTVFSALNAGEKVTSFSLISSIFIAVLIISVVYLFLLRVLRLIFDWLVKYKAGETMVLTALSLGVGFSYLAELVHLTPSIGAFLAGSLVASLPKGEELERAISPFALVFSSLFFMSIGMLINPGSLVKFWPIILAIAIANLVFKFIGTSVSAYLFGFSSKSAVFSGLALLSVGEFSLLIAKEGAEVITGGFDLVAITSVVVFISSLATSLSVGKYDSIHMISQKIMPFSLKQRGRRFAQYMREITDAFEPGHKFTGALQRAGVSILSNLSIIVFFVGVIGVCWYLFSNFTVAILGIEVNLFSIVMLLVSLGIIFFLLKMLKYVALEYNLVKLSLVTKHRHELSASHLAGDFLKLLLVLGLFLVIPFILSIMEVPQYLSRIILVFVFLVLVWRFLDLIGFEGDKQNRNALFFKD
ncbi:cation:proton antiporter [Candidatus Micrarchaeota archaeon]|nr:cation:proton antiporter [Candidatus Micrarchaeota archaeon]